MVSGWRCNTQELSCNSWHCWKLDCIAQKSWFFFFLSSHCFFLFFYFYDFLGYPFSQTNFVILITCFFSSLFCLKKYIIFLPIWSVINRHENGKWKMKELFSPFTSSIKTGLVFLVLFILCTFYLWGNFNFVLSKKSDSFSLFDSFFLNYIKAKSKIAWES